MQYPPNWQCGEWIVAGVDGCRGGWICFVVHVESRESFFRKIQTFSELMEPTSWLRVIAVDVPVGLVDQGARSCDIEARKLLRKPRSNSVFPAPVRATLEAQSYHQACQLSVGAHGKRLSKQTFGILPKIREVDQCITCAKQTQVFEVHPEVCFWALNGYQSMRYRKSKREGFSERISLLRTHYPTIETDIDKLAKRIAKLDDLLDSAAAAWTAERIARGAHTRVPNMPQFDSKGLRAEIVY